MKLSPALALTLPLLSTGAIAADLSVKFELPQLNVAEYHKPYVAMWIEKADGAVASTLAVLYDVKKKDNAGALADASEVRRIRLCRALPRNGRIFAQPFPEVRVTCVRVSKRKAGRRSPSS